MDRQVSFETPDFIQLSVLGILSHFIICNLDIRTNVVYQQRLNLVKQ